MKPRSGLSPLFILKPSRQCWEHLAAMAAAEKSASRHRTPGRAMVVSTNKKRRPVILPGLRDRKLAGGYLGSVVEFSPKSTVIASAYGKTLREMRRRKDVIYDALKSDWRMGQSGAIKPVCGPALAQPRGMFFCERAPRSARSR